LDNDLPDRLAAAQTLFCSRPGYRYCAASALETQASDDDLPDRLAAAHSILLTLKEKWHCQRAHQQG